MTALSFISSGVTGLSVVTYLWHVMVSVCSRRAGLVGQGRDGEKSERRLAVGVMGMSGSKI